ncbi:MAG: ABC transporter ATP-binding protein [Phycisphaerales bacterium]|nr:ABC transporter ATP-binding protein [Phycisphaerales bacterium]
MSALLAVENLRIATSAGCSDAPGLVEGMSFEVEAGSVVALVGESGSGKSLTALSMLQLLPHGVGVAGGSICLDGRELLDCSPREMSTIRGKQLGMVFQEPMTALNPVLTIGDQIEEVLRRHRGLSRSEARREAIALLERVAVPEPERCVKVYPHELSGGMRQRVVTAIAVAGSPRMLIADEPTTALDVRTQSLLLDLLVGFARNDGMGLLLITHDLSLVAERADHVYVLFRGHLCESGPVDAVLQHPIHPYTRGLLACTPRLDGPVRELPTIGDVVPDPSSELVDTTGGRRSAWWPDLPGGHHMEPAGEHRTVGVRGH